MEISAEQAFVDLFFLILFLRVVYIAISRGILCEIFKAVGLFIATIFAFHYYFSFGNYVNKKILLVSKEYLYPLCFFLILISIGGIFSILRLIITLLVVKKKDVSFPERWLSAFVGWGRAIFLSSVVIFLLHQGPFERGFFQKTISYRMFKNITPKVYLAFFRFYKKVNPKAVLNKEVEKYYKAR